MSDDTTRKQGGMTDASAAAVRHRRQRKRTWLIILSIGVIVIAATIGWRFLPSSSTQFGPITTEADVRAVRALSERDKKEIASLAREWTARHAFRALRSGEFRQCIRSLKISRQQRINRFIDDHDGTFRVYTVVDSPRDRDGWYAWSRLVMTKTNDQWVILRSY
jgi:hypothetical protein